MILPISISARRALTAVALAFSAMTSCDVRADDRILLRQDPFSDPIPTFGNVLDYTGRTIRFQTQAGSREEPADLVVRVETTYPDTFKRGQTQFDAGNYAEARAEWEQAVKQESRVWVQREIRSWLIRSDWRRGDWSSAGRQFLEIVQSDPSTPFWSVAPLLWSPVSLRESDRSAAREWIRSDVPVSKLLGASFLLTDATLGESAARTLEGLLTDTSPHVSELARAQLWRRRTAMSLTDEEIARWRIHLKSLPASLHSGPKFLLGKALLSRSEFDLAAAEFLWVSLIASEHEPTAARATLEAAEALERAGHREESLRMLQETMDRFSWSLAAKDAKARLQELRAANKKTAP